ncbi:MAG: TetR family transcriptional regulator [Acidobacteria bacterium]|nr:MAG: TetR family transcriptional regulator [Acidobacteriota bacterium]
MNTKKLQKKEAKRQLILEAAIRVFARHGFTKTSVSQVAREANVADGTIYLYFANKNELLTSIFDEAMSFFIAQATESLNDLNSAPEKLRKLATLHLRNLGENEDIATVFQVELRHSIRIMKHFSQTTLRAYLRLMEEIILLGQKEGSIRRELDPKILVKVFFGALDEMTTNWILRKRDYQLKEMVEPVLDILLNGIVPAEETPS